MKQTFKTTVLISALTMFAVSATVSLTGCAGDRTSRSTGAYLDDKAINAKVKSKFVADPVVKAAEIKVDTYQGQVQLSGFVDNEQQKQRAEEIARTVNGVMSVQNNINIKPEAAGAPR